MNIKNLPKGSYKVVDTPQTTGMLNVKDLPQNSYKVVGDNTPLASAETAPQPSRNLLQKTAGFLGIEKFGQGLSTIGSSAPQEQANQSAQNTANAARLLKLYHSATSPVQKEHLANTLKALGTDVSATDINSGFGLSNREVLGSAANVGLNVFAGGELSGAAKAGGFASRVAPELVSGADRLLTAAKPVLEGGGLMGSVGRNAALGGAFGAAAGLNDNKSGTDLLKSTVTGTALGAAIPLAGRVASKAKRVLTEVIPERLYNRAVKPTLDELRRNVRYGSDTLGKELMQEGVHGSPEKLLAIAGKNLNANEERLQSMLKGSKGVVTRKSLEPYLQKLKDTAAATPGLGQELDKITSVLMEFPREIPVSQANQIKRNIYNELRNPGYKLDASLSTKKEAMKALASGIKREIEKQFGGTVIADINKKLSIYGRLEDRIVDVIARNNRNNLFGLTDAILAGGGLAAGSPVGFGLAAAKHAAGSTRFQTSAAVGLNQLKNVGSGVVGRTAKNLTKRAILNAP